MTNVYDIQMPVCNQNNYYQNPYVNNPYYSPRHYDAPRPLNNLKYEGENFKVDVNVSSTNTLCLIGGCAIGAALAYYFLKK